jgi:hypothetical protein
MFKSRPFVLIWRTLGHLPPLDTGYGGASTQGGGALSLSFSPPAPMRCTRDGTRTRSSKQGTPSFYAPRRIPPGHPHRTHNSGRGEQRRQRLQAQPPSLSSICSRLWIGLPRGPHLYAPAREPQVWDCVRYLWIPQLCCESFPRLVPNQTDGAHP